MNKKSKILTITKIVFAAFILGMFYPAIEGHAETGQTYTCTVNRGYRHPVTGVIEDAGGEGSYAVGQGMIEGCVQTTGLLEETESGQCYLTIRMAQMDFSSGHSFKVQPKGGSGWTAVSPKITSSSGTTADFCIPVPQKDCVVRGEMYVTAMGRNVVFFAYPSGFSEGNHSGMNATIVTAPPAPVQETPAQETPAQEETAPAQEEAAVQEEQEATTEETAEEQAEEAVVEEPEPQTDADTLEDAQGLTLSTAKEKAKEAESDQDAVDTKKSNHMPFVIGAGVALVLAIAGCAVYFVKKNKNKGDTRDDDE